MRRRQDFTNETLANMAFKWRTIFAILAKKLHIMRKRRRDIG
jgi:hypothetical protein